MTLQPNINAQWQVTKEIFLPIYLFLFFGAFFSFTEKKMVPFELEVVQ